MTDIVLQPHPASRRIPESDPDPIVGGRVELQLLTTLKCNLKCTYCSLGVGDVLGSQNHVEYTVDELAAFVDKHLQGKEVYVTFYGGEPTLNLDMMLEVMRRFPLFRFQLQTNGTLLDDIPDWALGRLSNILVSIDGGEATTDGYRGRGIYRQVLKNLAAVRDKIGGTVTARVTWGNPATTFEELDELVSADGHEVLWADHIADLPAGVRELVEAELSSREFVPEIARIVQVSSFACPSVWEIETDRGATHLTLKGEEDIRRLTPTRLLISDAHGIQYLIRDTQALDRQSRKLLDRFL